MLQVMTLTSGTLCCQKQTLCPRPQSRVFSPKTRNTVLKETLPSTDLATSIKESPQSCSAKEGILTETVWKLCLKMYMYEISGS